MLEFVVRQRRLTLSVVAGIAALLLVSLFAALVLPVRCMTGLWGDGTCPANAAVPSRTSTHATLPEVPSLPPGTQLSAPVLDTALLTSKPSGYGLVASTFSQLSTDSPESANQVSGQQTIVGSTGQLPLQPTTRVVATTIVHAGQPISAAMPSPSTDISSNSADTVMPQNDTPAPVVEPVVASVEPSEPDAAATATDDDQSEQVASAPVPAPDNRPDVVEPSPRGKRATHPDDDNDIRSGSAVVGGAGVTVRSGPSKGKSGLFNLAAGQHVKIQGDQKGWLHITDDKGRSGWVYQNLVKRG